MPLDPRAPLFYPPTPQRPPKPKLSLIIPQTPFLEPPYPPKPIVKLPPSSPSKPVVRLPPRVPPKPDTKLPPPSPPRAVVKLPPSAPPRPIVRLPPLLPPRPLTKPPPPSPPPNPNAPSGLWRRSGHPILLAYAKHATMFHSGGLTCDWRLNPVFEYGEREFSNGQTYTRSSRWPTRTWGEEKAGFQPTLQSCWTPPRRMTMALQCFPPVLERGHSAPGVIVHDQPPPDLEPLAAALQADPARTLVEDSLIAALHAYTAAVAPSVPSGVALGHMDNCRTRCLFVANASYANARTRAYACGILSTLVDDIFLRQSWVDEARELAWNDIEDEWSREGLVDGIEMLADGVEMLAVGEGVEWDERGMWRRRSV